MIKFILYITVVYICLSLYYFYSNKNNCKYVLYKHSIKYYIENPLIFGFAVDYKIKKMNLFISSLRLNGYNKDVVMGISAEEYNRTKSFINYYNIIPILIEDKWPFYSSHNKQFHLNFSYLNRCSIKYRNYKVYKWNVYRFSVLYCWLQVYGNIYSHILSIDVRDVVFQGNPFEWNFKNGLYFFEENSENIFIKNNPTNLLWVKQYKNYNKIINNNIINSGSIFGIKKYFISFLAQFCQFINENNVITNEQGSLNYAYYTGYFKNIKFLKQANQKGIILTTGIDLPSIKKNKIENSTIYNKDGTIPLIVHQYDRCKEFIEMYIQKYKL